MFGIPESLYKALWTQLYKDLGHLGFQRTYIMIRRQYHWKDSFRSIVDLNTKCIPCQDVNLKQEMYPMEKSQLPRFPWDKIAIDTTGPYPTS